MLIRRVSISQTGRFNKFIFLLYVVKELAFKWRFISFGGFHLQKRKENLVKKTSILFTSKNIYVIRMDGLLNLHFTNT